VRGVVGLLFTLFREFMQQQEGVMNLYAKKIDSVFAGEMNNYSSATHPTPFPEAKT